jgi:hypothetical protein
MLITTQHRRTEFTPFHYCQMFSPHATAASLRISHDSITL